METENLIEVLSKAGESRKKKPMSNRTKLNKVLRYYNAILRIDSKNIETINAKAKLLEKLGDKQGAIRHYDLLLQLNPNYPLAKKQLYKLMNKLIAYA